MLHPYEIKEDKFLIKKILYPKREYMIGHKGQDELTK